MKQKQESLKMLQRGIPRWGLNYNRECFRLSLWWYLTYRLPQAMLCPKYGHWGFCFIYFFGCRVLWRCKTIPLSSSLCVWRCDLITLLFMNKGFLHSNCVTHSWSVQLFQNPFFLSVNSSCTETGLLEGFLNRDEGSSWQEVQCHSPVRWPDELVLHTNLAAQDTIVAAYHM